MLVEFTSIPSGAEIVVVKYSDENFGEYKNHSGAVDALTETVVEGNGTATTDVPNHEMDLSTGITISSNAIFQTKQQWTLGSKAITINFIVQNIQSGVAGTRQTQVGLAKILGQAGSSTPGRYYNAVFGQVATDEWFCRTANTVSGGTTTSVTVSNNDLLTIVATSAEVLFYINNILVATHTTDIPTGLLYCGASTYTTAAGATIPRQISIDYMSIKYPL